VGYAPNVVTTGRIQAPQIKSILNREYLKSIELQDYHSGSFYPNPNNTYQLDCSSGCEIN
jgi:hypothetical protein